MVDDACLHVQGPGLINTAPPAPTPNLEQHTQTFTSGYSADGL